MSLIFQRDTLFVHLPSPFLHMYLAHRHFSVLPVLVMPFTLVYSITHQQFFLHKKTIPSINFSISFPRLGHYPCLRSISHDKNTPNENPYVKAHRSNVTLFNERTITLQHASFYFWLEWEICLYQLAQVYIHDHLLSSVLSFGWLFVQFMRIHWMTFFLNSL